VGGGDYRIVWMKRSIFSNKMTKVADADQCFYFILKRIAFIGGVAIVFVIFTVLGHISVGEVQGFAW